MPSERARDFSLDPSITFLNHGSFGACPRQVLLAQQKLREQMESEPLRFFIRELEPLLDAARTELARFVGADAEGVAFVANATTGVNAVARSLELRPGDEILSTNHAYNACQNALEFVAEGKGARVISAKLPFPLTDPEEVVEALLRKVTPKTRVAMIDHVTSPTGLVLPVERLVRELEGRGIDVIVDGAHAPGMLPLDLRALGASYYTGNLHKWVCAPKGAAFLHVREDKRERVRPTVISHGANSPRTDRSRYLLEFDWVGTSDPTPFLSVPEALRAVGAMSPDGFPGVMAENRALALRARALLCASLGVPAPAPESMIGSLAAVPLPASKDKPSCEALRDPVQDALFERFAIEVPVFPFGDGRLVRVSAQRYNDIADYERLAAALAEIFAG